MKHPLITIFFLAVFANSTFSQIWASASGNLYNDPLSTKIGIGLNNPETLLSLHKSATLNDDLISISYDDLSGKRWNYFNIGTNYLTFNARQRNNIWEVDDGSFLATASRISYEWEGLHFYYYNHPTNQQGASTQTWTSFIGNWKPAMIINRGGNIKVGEEGIVGGPHQDFRFSVDGKIVAKEIVVTMSNWADYVFSDDYQMLSLEDLEKHINAKYHLPNVPPESEITKNGLDLSEMMKIHMEKIEELNLYVIQLNKELKKVKADLEQLKSKQNEK